MDWLRKRREEVGLETQEDLATQLQLEGVTTTRASVSHWENGRNKPPLDEPIFRAALAKVLRLSQPELLRLAGYEVVRSAHSESGERAAHILDQLPAEKQQLALKVLEQFLE
jgi:transcriptional regulator with XRE-family HTH domain